MILITRATTNTVYATCTEKSVLTSPSYIFKFHSDTRKEYRYCSATDTSTYPERYQQFSIVETTTPTALSNQVKLDISRSWKYYIYELTAAQLAAVTDFATVDYDSLTLVEQGKVKVLDASPTTKQTYTGNQSTFKEYGG